MNPIGIRSLLSGALLLGALAGVTSCNEPAAVAQTARGTTGSGGGILPHRSIEAGTRIPVALAQTISSETASPGDAWRGTTTQYVSTRNGAEIPAGAEVSGVVVHATPAVRGSRASLELAIRSIQVDGRTRTLDATSEAVVAGSPRARNLGAIAGGAAAGALIGKAVGDGKNSAVGGLLGGAAAAGVVASSRGYQVVLKDGTVISFTVGSTVAMR